MYLTAENCSVWLNLLAASITRGLGGGGGGVGVCGGRGKKSRAVITIEKKIGNSMMFCHSFDAIGLSFTVQISVTTDKL